MVDTKGTLSREFFFNQYHKCVFSFVITIYLDKPIIHSKPHNICCKKCSSTCVGIFMISIRSQIWLYSIHWDSKPFWYRMTDLTFKNYLWVTLFNINLSLFHNLIFSLISFVVHFFLFSVFIINLWCIFMF